VFYKIKIGAFGEALLKQ